MNKYIFGLDKELKAQSRISVYAESTSAAVQIVNRALREKGDKLWGASESLEDLPPVEWMLHLGAGSIDETMFVGEDAPPLTDDLLEAYRFLDGAGFGYASTGEGNAEEVLARDDAPLFTKPLWTEDGAGVDAYLLVRAKFEDDVGGYNFQIEAILYPTGRGDLARGESPFRARFEDKQHFMGANDLPQTVEVYEKKFVELIKLVRRAESSGSN